MSTRQRVIFPTTTYYEHIRTATTDFGPTVTIGQGLMHIDGLDSDGREARELETLMRLEQAWVCFFITFSLLTECLYIYDLRYAIRKKEMWQDHARRSDRIFRLLNDAYKSPL